MESVVNPVQLTIWNTTMDTPENPVKKYTCIDLFSGAGGLSRGLEHAGFKMLFASDINPVYGETYRQNHPHTHFVDKDIRSLTGKEILTTCGLKKGELDLLAGGPPCQGFSINAPIRSLADQRNHLFKEYLRIAAELFPKAILIENVPGIISMGKGTVVKAIYKELEDMGYKVEHHILFAGHYGVPQMRFRTIFIATRLEGAKIIFPTPTHNAKAYANFTGAKELCLEITEDKRHSLKKQTSVWDAIRDLPSMSPLGKPRSIGYKEQPKNPFLKFVRGKSVEIYNHTTSGLAQINLERLKYIPQGGSWRDIPHELLPAGLKRARRSDHTKRYGRLHPDGLCSTVLTKCDPHWGSFFHPFQDRIISVREAARIQSFPDDFVFTGSITQQYEQVGNAVPVLLAKTIGESVIKMLATAKTKVKK